MLKNKNNQVEKQLNNLNFSDQEKAIVNQATILIEKEKEYDEQLQRLSEKQKECQSIIDNYAEKEKHHQAELSQLKQKLHDLAKKKWTEARINNLTAGFLAFGNNIENIPGAGPFLKTGTQKFGQWIFAQKAEFIDYFFFGSIFTLGFISPYVYKLGKIGWKIGAKILKSKTAGIIDIEQMHQEINPQYSRSINQGQPGSPVIINFPSPNPPQLPPIIQPRNTDPRPRNKRGQFIKQKNT